MTPDLTVNLGKVRLSNPVMPASGTFGYGEEYADLIDLNRLGAIVTKGISVEPRQGNPPPRIWETASGMLNSIGLQNVGLRVFLDEKLAFLRRYAVPVIVNCFGYTIAEYVDVVGQLSDSDGIAALEVNLSCPNVKQGGIQFGCRTEMVAALIEKLRKRTSLPLFVKLSSVVSDIQEIAHIAENEGADALTLINSIPAMAVDLDSRRPRLGAVTGGLSGPAIKPVALKVVWDVVSTIHIPVIGVGGITNHRDALEFLMVGATAIQVGTANFSNPMAMIGIIDGVQQYLSDRAIPCVADLIGSLEL
jgi:dihydroorotate dehydrogenase (NAD+) catalytic subunit